MKLQISSLTDKGCKRENNEDIGLIMDQLLCDNPIQSVLDVQVDAPIIIAVADGMGGRNGGEVASQMAVERLIDFRATIGKEDDFNRLVELFNPWITNTTTYIRQEGLKDESLRGMGTTLVGMIFTKKSVTAFNIGDSRLYRFRGGWLRQESKDHSQRNLTGDMNVPSNMIYNSLGAGSQSFADYFNLTGEVKKGDIYLLCSDGLNDMLCEEDIENLLKEHPTANKLVEAAKTAGGKDNITVILIMVSD
jgi:protein phosphatase